MSMTKVALALPEQMLRALALIEEDTDRPRTRIIRRALGDFLRQYAKDNPGFMERVGTPTVVEKVFRSDIRTDVVMIRGAKQTVVVTEDGWRQPRPEDYVEVDNSLLSILDQENE